MTSTMIELPDGLALHASIEGPQGRPGVIMSNSLATNLSLWDAFAASLRDRYRVLRYDQRGHGKSSVPPPPYGMPQLVKDVIGLMDKIGIDRAHFVGISMGGATGMGLALHHADRLRSLVACDSSIAASPTNEWQQRLDIVKAQGLSALVEPTLARWFTKRSMAENTPAVQRVREMIRTTPENGFIGCVNALQTFDYSQGLETIALPVLMVAGAEDGTRPEAMAKDAARIPGAQFAVIPDAGHLSNIENPRGFNRIVGAFIDGVG